MSSGAPLLQRSVGELQAAVLQAAEGDHARVRSVRHVGGHDRRAPRRDTSCVGLRYLRKEDGAKATAEATAARVEAGLLQRRNGKKFMSHHIRQGAVDTWFLPIRESG
jgi:hypothetical protein